MKTKPVDSRIRLAFSLFTIIVIAICTTDLAIADDKNSSAFTDEKKAGKDFQVQGEYTAETENGMKIGIQVMALGGGKFDLVAYMGGLPGDGWSRGGDTLKAKGNTKGEMVVFAPESNAEDAEKRGRAEWKDGSITVYDPEGNSVLKADKVTRKSPTLGSKPPEGAVILFDGSSAETFENGKMLEGNLLAATNCTSKEKLGDHVLHVEFRTPFMPTARGQGRGNSGVYIESRYECQVLDSFGLDGKDNECGGIYQISKPVVNMCFPPLAWQTYDIDYVAAKYEGVKKTKNATVTIKHNGVVIHDQLELPRQTPGCKQEGPQALGVFFQNHGNPVAYRNIWAVKK
ncbi:DUF1080 domain-containing protein [Pirellulaceae bacterium]|nr:DUF1080 domain-containing protein [Pirellulaceae bacterium]